MLDLEKMKKELDDDMNNILSFASMISDDEKKDMLRPISKNDFEDRRNKRFWELKVKFEVYLMNEKRFEKESFYQSNSQ